MYVLARRRQGGDRKEQARIREMSSTPDHRIVELPLRRYFEKLDNILASLEEVGEDWEAMRRFGTYFTLAVVPPGPARECRAPLRASVRVAFSLQASGQPFYEVALWA